MNVYDYSECDEVAGNLPWPKRQIGYSEALKLVRGWMPDESETIISNVAWAGAQASLSIPPTWKEVDEARYDEMLGVLPPIAWTDKGFLVGEPMSHLGDQPTFVALVRHHGRYYESEGSITIAAWRALDPREVKP